MSRFPGMDPFIEEQIWEDFHTAYIVALRDLLVPQLGEGYFAVVEARVYIEHHLDQQPIIVPPDVAITASGVSPRGRATSRSNSTPVLVPLAMPLEIKERFLTIRLRDTREVVTVLELLSPTNKRGGSDGRREYLAKREAVLRSGSHLVELDLLRGGQRLPMASSLPDGDYYAIVSRVSSRPMAEVWAWFLPDPLPPVNVPLREADADVVLDLQAAFDGVCQRGGYRVMIDYSRPLHPSLSAQTQSWLHELLS